MRGALTSASEVEAWLESEEISIAALTETLLDPRKGNPYNGIAECARYAHPGRKLRGGVSLRLRTEIRHRTVLRITEENVRRWR